MKVIKVEKIKKADAFTAKRTKPDMIKKINGWLVEIWADAKEGYFYVLKVPALGYNFESEQKFKDQMTALNEAKQRILLAHKKLDIVFK